MRQTGVSGLEMFGVLKDEFVWAARVFRADRWVVVKGVGYAKG